MKGKPRNRHEPSAHEKCQKIEQAITALDAGNITIIADRHNQQSMDFLDAVDMEEVLDWIAVFLREIRTIGPIACFVGKVAHPSDHGGFQDLHLFPYHWDSPSLGAQVYLKFGIKSVKDSNGNTHTYCHLDCHEDRP